MRKRLVNILTELMESDSSVHLLTGDTGFHVFDELQKRFPERYLNVGIAEATMISLAAGLAKEGAKVFVYGIAPFVTLRCFEQIRVDLCHARLPVKIVGVGGGLTYGPAGMTHHTIEDIAVLSALPNMTIVCPGDPVEVEAAVRASMSLTGPCYLRLGKSGEETLHAGPLKDFAIGKAIRMRPGRDIALLATGNMLAAACEVRGRLEQHGLRPELISVHTLKPIDREMVLETARRCPILVTLEEHNLIGGLGSRVAEIVADEGLGATRVWRFGIPDCYADRAGSQQHLRREYGLTAPQIAEQLLRRARSEPAGAGPDGPAAQAGKRARTGTEAQA